MMLRRFAPFILGLAALGGCAVGPNYQAPQTAMPAGWASLHGVPTTQPGATTRPAGPTMRPADVAEWWKTLQDPQLDALIVRAVDANLDLRVAQLRVTEARATRGMVAADLWPQVNVGGGYTYRGSSRNAGPKSIGGLSQRDQARNDLINTAVRKYAFGQASSAATSSFASTGGNLVSSPATAIASTATGTVAGLLQGNEASVSRDQSLFQLGFDASWELDVFGGNRRAVEAADADTAAIHASVRDALVTLVSEVALDYVRLRGNQRRLVIALENIDIQRESLELTRRRQNIGFESELAVAQAQALLASTQSQVPVLCNAIRQNIYQLSVLLAQPPGALVAELEATGPIPKVPGEVPIGLPSDLLRRRPDIRVAERQLAASTARIGEAIADLFPKFSLTGSIGPSSRTTRHLLDQGSLGWSVGPGITWPIFDGWRIRSNIAVQNAREAQSLAIYQQTVLVALQDVENSLEAYQQEQVRYGSLVEAVHASQRATDLSRELYDHGATNFLNVLDSQRALYASQDDLVVSETTVITNLISLYKALGGGWESTAEATPAVASAPAEE